jgi:RNA polymerase sigma-70 factor (ECF subfamily)
MNLPTDDSSNDLARHRSYVLAIAYRMTGSYADAEDIAQETLMRFRRAAREATVRDPRALLAKIATRLSLNALRSSRRRREDYYGVWLPEPLPEDTLIRERLQSDVDVSDMLSYAYLAMLERLTPFERAVLLLKDAFGYAYAEIAAILQREEPACRKASSRARQRLGTQAQRCTLDPEERRRLVERFMDAVRQGDLESLMQVLKDDVVMWTDGGGKARATRLPLRGAETVALFVIGSLKLLAAGAQVSLERAHGEPAIVARLDGRVQFIMMVEFEGARLSSLYGLSNPDKLGHLH